MASPVKFVKPAELFRMRQARKQEYKFDITSQSPLKCLTDPSPIKNIPTLLRNPFKGKGVKRRLSLDCSNNSTSSSLTPRKRGYPTSSNSSSPRKSIKRTKFSNLEMDEDANMEAPHLNSNGASYCDSDFDDDDDEENDEDATSFLERLGMTVSQQDFPSLEKFK